MKFAPRLMLGILVIASLTACGPDREKAFLDEYRERVPDSVQISDDQLLGTAETTCRQLEEGKTLEEIRSQSITAYAKYMGGQPDDEAMNRIISGGEAAAQKYCPEAVNSK